MGGAIEVTTTITPMTAGGMDTMTSGPLEQSPPTTLDDLRRPPGNRLEKLRKDRDGQHSIRVNDQWRVCFRWRDGAAYDVEIVDYH